MQKYTFGLSVFAVAGSLAIPGVANSADIKVLSDGPLKPALTKIAATFSHEKGHTVQFVFATSPVLHKKIAAGETGDVLVVQPNFIDRFITEGKVPAGKYAAVARVGIGLAVRAGARAPDISTSDAFKTALLGADRIVFNSVASGNYFAKVLERLEIADAVKAKVVRTIPAEVFKRIAEGKGNGIGIGSMTQIIADKRLKLAGALPADYQSYLVYAAAPMVGAHSPEAAREFVAYLASPATKAAFAAAGAD